MHPALKARLMALSHAHRTALMALYLDAPRRWESSTPELTFVAIKPELDRVACDARARLIGACQLRRDEEDGEAMRLVTSLLDRAVAPAALHGALCAPLARRLGARRLLERVEFVPTLLPIDASLEALTQHLRLGSIRHPALRWRLEAGAHLRSLCWTTEQRALLCCELAWTL